MAVLVLLTGLLALGLHALHRKAEEARARDHSLDGRIAAITQERQGYMDLMRQPANAQLLTQVGALNSLFDEKTFSWTLAMEDLETVLPGGVQVSTLEPVRGKDGRIVLHLRVIGPRDRAVELVANLEHSRHFLHPSIVGENAETTGGAGERLEPVSASNRVNFDLLAEYNSAAPENDLKSAAKTEEAAAPAPVRQAAPAPARTAPGVRAIPAVRPAQVPVQPGRIVPQQPGQGPVRPPYMGPNRPMPQRPLPNTQPNNGGPR
jgi:type IV pilus assembly protein PilN